MIVKKISSTVVPAKNFDPASLVEALIEKANQAMMIVAWILHARTKKLISCEPFNIL